MKPDKNKIIIDKTIYAKYLYQKGTVELSNGTDLSASVAILLIFDAVEMIVLALEEKLGLDNKDNSFPSRVNKIKDRLKPDNLPLERQILEINSARRNFKHGAQIQNADNIKSLSVYALDFMNQASEEVLGFNFEDASLSSLIIDKKVKILMRESEELIKKEKYYDAITAAGKSYMAFFFINKDDDIRKRFFKNDNWRWGNNRLSESIGDVDAQQIIESFAELYNFASLSILNIDIKSYSKFRFLIPSINTNMKGDFFINHIRNEENNEENSIENAQFCLSFVLDIILKTQRN